MRPGLVVLGCVIAVLVSPSPLAGSRPESSARISGLGSSVEVVTDRWGIPHVRAASLPDLYRAWGWVHARDRLWQMVSTRAAAHGKTHRWLGNAALRADGGAQLFRFRERAREIWERERQDPDVRSAFEAYAVGVNAYLAECRRGARPWPAELVRLRERPEDWTPEDCIAVLLGFGLTLDLDLPELAEARQVAEHGAAWVEERRRHEDRWIYDSIPDSAVRRLWPRAALATSTAGGAERSVRGARAPSGARETRASLSPAAARAIEGWLAAYPPHEGDGASRASNAFVVGAARSASGKPVLANDPHLGLATPGPIHVIHVSVPGVVDAIGGGAAGLPVIVLGRNARAAWGVTALSADVCDVYADTLSEDGKRVRHHGPDGTATWRPVETRGFDMTFRVLGVPLPVPTFLQARRYTPHGPVLSWEPKRRLALTLRWAAFEDERIHLSRLVGLERSVSADEVMDRFATLVTPCFNVVAADAAGEARFRSVGLIPVRAHGVAAGVLPSDGRHEWSGFIPAGEMPAWRVPPSGFVANGNNRPAGEHYPYPFARFDWPHDRARRIAQRLAGDTRITLADAASVQNDVYSLAAERTVPLLVARAESLRDSLTERARSAVDTLRAWDFRATRSRIAPALYRAWYGAYQRRMRTEGLPGLTFATLEGAPLESLARLGVARPAARAAVASLGEALDSLAAKLGRDPSRWTYGRAHLARFRHVLSGLDPPRRWDAPLTPEDGDNATPSVGASRLPWSLEVSHGPAFRHIVDLARPESSLAVVAPWNSAAFPPAGDRDLRARWANHAYIPLLLDRERIAEVAWDRVTLEP